MTPLGVGIIGCGNISETYLRLAPLFSGFDIRAIADINSEAAQARAAPHAVVALSVETLLAADDIDLIVNLTIPSAHFSVSKDILEAGKHVYSEKPMVLSLQEGKELGHIAEKAKLRVGSAPDTFLGGTHQQARALIDSGALGQIVSGTAHVMGRGMEHWHPNPDFFFKQGGGPMLDMGPYYITNLVQLLGPVRYVMAQAASASPTRTILSDPRKGETIRVETPTTLHAILTFVSGAIITLGTSWDVKAHKHSAMELYGTEGSLFLPDPNFFAGDLERSDIEGALQTVPTWDHPFSTANEDTSTKAARANYRAAGVADMATAITEGRPHRCSLDLALHVVEVMTAALESAKAGQPIEMSTRCERPAPLCPDQARALMK